MNFELTDEQTMLRDSAAAFVRKESPVKRFRSLRKDGYQRAMWKRLAELGWLGIPFSPDVGGMGGSFVDLSLVLAELGATLVPEPFISSVVLGGMALQKAGSPEQQKRWLEPMIAGELTLALAHADEVRAEHSGSDWRLFGTHRFVLDGNSADVVLVSAGNDLFAVDRKDVSKTTVVSTMDGRFAAHLSFDGVTVAEDRRLAKGSPNVLEDIIDLGAAAACCEGAGILKQVLAMTREHLCTREQFGVKIGSFQALQHRAAEMFIEVELMKSAAILAAVSAENPDRALRRAEISTAKVQLSLSGRFVTQQSIQLHGGIGITDEHDIGLFFKRTMVLNALFGDEVHHLERLMSRA